jgi:hypothetical protein
MDATGNIIKKTTQEKTFFVRCQHDSPRAREIFSDKPKYNDKPISVLQVMVISNDGWLMAECSYI